MSCERWSRKNRAASTPMSSSSSSSVTNSPWRFDIFARWPPSIRLTSCMIRSSSEPSPPPSACHDGEHPLDVPVVVGAPDVDHAVVSALALVLVVGDVGGEVGRLAGGPDQHAVLVVAERRTCAASARPRARRRARRAARARARRRRPRTASAPRRSGRSGRGSARASPRPARIMRSTPSSRQLLRVAPRRRPRSRPRARRRTRPGSRPRAAPRRAPGRGSTRRSSRTCVP